MIENEILIITKDLKQILSKYIKICEQYDVLS